MTTLEISNKPSIHNPQSPLKRLSTSSDLLSFEEMHKSSYSHGLEAIYTLQNVDIKSIRRIETSSKPLSSTTENKKSCSRPLQEEFDFGDEFRGWIVPFLKREPIQVLELSRHTEKCLIENGKSLLGDIMGVNLKDFVFLRGMGQGHIEEISRQLTSYLEGQDLDKSYKVDFASWLKCLFASQDRKKVVAFLEVYNLAHLFFLTPGENMEVRKLTPEKKLEWNTELLNKIGHPNQKKSIYSDMQHIFNIFIKPWVKQRHGFATHEELLERMQRISTNSHVCSSVLKVLQSVCFETIVFFNLFLKEIDQGLYCSDNISAQNYSSIVNKALTYFYKPLIYYSLNDLVRLLEREFARSWMGFSEGTIEKVLRLSPTFCTIKGKLGLEIYKQ